MLQLLYLCYEYNTPYHTLCSYVCVYDDVTYVYDDVTYEFYHKTVVAVNALSARVPEGVPINNPLS